MTAAIKLKCPRCGKGLANFHSIGGHVRWCSVTREELFWAKVDKSAGPDGCWTWAASHRTDGYPQVPIGHTNLAGHRYAYQVTKGPIPPGKFVMHSCDNRGCVNPAHLSLGSRMDNVQDAVAKRRHAWGDRNSNARLSKEDVLAIRALKGKERAKDIAKRYGVIPNHISNILARRVWAMLP